MTTADEKKTDAAETSTVQNNENDANGKGDASDKGGVNSKDDASGKGVVNSKGDANDKDCVNCEDCASREGNETKKRRDSKRRGFLAAGFGAVALFAVVAFFIGGAAPEPPTEFAALDRAPTIYPDYCDVTIPPNVAPLNFDVQENAEEILTRVFEDGAERPVATFSGKEIRFSQRKWRRLLERNVGKTLRFETFALNVVGDSANGEKSASVGDSANGEKSVSVGDSANGEKPASVGDSANGEKSANGGKWVKYADWEMRVAPDSIDPWVSYRLVFPGYEYYSDLALWSRSLETFEERPIIRARLVAERTCVNCHTFQAGRTDSFLFHLRFKKGGTVVVDRGAVKKVDLNAEGLDAGCAYAAWRPNSPHVAFSSNQTSQIFHSRDKNRINVLDSFSDLLLYDVEKNELTPILPSDDDYLPTYPTWSPDGKTLYYCCAKAPDFKTPRQPVAARKDEVPFVQDEFQYDIMKVAFDEKTGKFGAPELVFNAVALDKSAAFPRVSPDGKSLMFTLARRGCFPIWFRDADLWTLDLATGEARALDEVNSPTEPDSWHSWSSNGRWFVFSSRRDDGSHTRLYFAHIGENGEVSKPFMLPQRDPAKTLNATKSFNVPEFTVEPVQISERELLQKAKIDAPEKATLRLR
ncbi:MAG: PD40 domain-containing protein [Thermoguttaceae bacterium]|nr:PD40 domain-containing protein [Thermoguttaceae bacterium]